jgi:hypothetical protein
MSLEFFSGGFTGLSQCTLHSHSLHLFCKYFVSLNFGLIESVSVVDSLVYGTEHASNGPSLNTYTCETYKLVALLPDCNLAAKKWEW